MVGLLTSESVFFLTSIIHHGLKEWLKVLGRLVLMVQGLII